MAKMKVKTHESLEDAMSDYILKVDLAAEKMREPLITSLPGQVMTYQQKQKEALNYPDNGPFPFMEAEAEALGMTVQEVVDSILNSINLMETFGKTIEAQRLKAKKLIRESQSANEMRINYENFISELAS